MRTPTDQGPPACWGRFRGDASCARCCAATACETAAGQLKRRKTLAEALAAMPVDGAAVEIDAEEMVRFIQRCIEEARGNAMFVRMVQQPAWIDAATNITRACRHAHWDPRTYVQAQVATLTPLLERGCYLRPAHFVGAKADARFELWVHRKKKAFGNPRLDRAQAETKAAERFKAATFRYAVARVVEDVPDAAARALARELFPTWRRADVSPRLRLEAFTVACGALDVTLPHRLLLAETWSWKEGVRAARLLAGADLPSARPAPEGLEALGDAVV